jgi:hypothetical protein
MQTELVINRGGFPPFSARGCQQTLQPITTGELRRTVNGELLYTGKKGHHKYRSTIWCQDQTSPALDGIWRGERLTISCIQRLWQELLIEKDTLSVDVKLERPAVQGSIVLLREHEELRTIFLSHPSRTSLSIMDPLKAGDKLYLSYRPQLQMRVIDFQFTMNEWQQSCGWRLELEEI